jgi:periplasmic protein TonB
MPRVTSLRERRAVWSWLSLSVGLHAAAFGGLVLALRARPSQPRLEAGGSGIMLVELVGAGSIAGDAPRPAAAPENARRPAPPATRTTPPQRPAAATAPERSAPEPPRSAKPPVPESPGAGPPAVAAAPAAQGTSAETGEAGPLVAAASVAAGPVGSGSLSRVARPASEIRPRYPEAARARGDEAEVIVEAWVAASGRVERAWVRSSAGPEFDGAALAAVREARFHPAWRDGAPADSLVAMRLHFELEP